MAGAYAAYIPVIRDAPFKGRMSGESLLAPYRESYILVLGSVPYLHEIRLALAF
jgi:hypothetical protein